MKRIRGMVCIVGRPNVGKSTLFNAMTQTRKALVLDQPGLTRDRIYGLVEYADTAEDEKFWLIDTGGFETKDTYYQPFSDNKVWQQALEAIRSADIVVFVADGRAGLHPLDHQLMSEVRRLDKPTMVVANKLDSLDSEAATSDFFALGVDEVYPLSAAHSRYVGDLRERLSTKLREINSAQKRITDEDNLIPVAIIGRPNVGKSSLVNRLAGQERSIVSDVAGTTRDAVDVFMSHKGKEIQLVDTAGIRRRARIDTKVESLSVISSLKAIEAADVVILVVDAIEGFADQEARLASLALDQNKALLIVVNKWDLVNEKTPTMGKNFIDAIKARIELSSYVPVLLVSCHENQRVFKILDELVDLHAEYSRRAGTAEINRALEKLIRMHTPSIIKKHNKRIKFYYATQVHSAPPTIVVKCNVADEIQESYRRYLIKGFKEELGFPNVPLQLYFRGKTESRDQDSPRD